MHLAAAQILLAFFSGSNPETAYIEFTHKVLLSDANNWHYRAAQLAAHWWGEPAHLWMVQHPRYEGYVVILGAVYFLLGSKLWAAQLFNAAACFFSGVMAYKLGIYVGQPPKRMRLLALLVVLWPPSFIYSAVTMRYGYWLFLVFGALVCITLMLNPQVRKGSTLLLACLGLGLICYNAVAIRDYLGIHLHLMLLPSALLVWLGPKKCRNPVLRKRVLWAYPAAVICIVLAVKLPMGMFLPEDMRSRRVEPRTRAYNQAEVKDPSKIKEVAAWEKGQKKPKTAKKAKKNTAKKPPSRTEGADARAQKTRPASEPAAGDKKPNFQKPKPHEKPSIIKRYWDFLFTNTWGRLMFERWAYVITGGESQTPQARKVHQQFIETGQRYIPHGFEETMEIIFVGLKDFLFFPWPWQQWPKGQAWMSLPVALNTLLWYAMLPGLFWGMFRAARRNLVASLPSLTWIILVGFVLAVVVVNLGTLYRFRDAVFLVMIVFFDPAPYIGVWNRLSGRRETSV